MKLINRVRNLLLTLSNERSNIFTCNYASNKQFSIFHSNIWIPILFISDSSVIDILSSKTYFILYLHSVG